MTTQGSLKIQLNLERNKNYVVIRDLSLNEIQGTNELLQLKDGENYV